VADKFGIDVYRYFLLRDVPFGLDGNFSEEALVKRFNADLANDLGNLVFRTLTMIEKYYRGVIPQAQVARDSGGRQIEEMMISLSQKISSTLRPESDFNFSMSLSMTWELINMANKYVEEKKPWNLAKEKRVEELAEFIALLVKVIRVSAETLNVFMPQTAESILRQIGQNQIEKGQPLFPRIDTQKT
jgi:methionyl-tRNA synthetase